MQVHSSVSRISRILFAFLLVAGSVALVGSNKPSSPGQNPWRDKALVDFVNPGLNITINSAAISSAGVITVTYTLTDPIGIALGCVRHNHPGPHLVGLRRRLHPQGSGAICRLHDCLGDGRRAGHHHRAPILKYVGGAGRAA